MSDPMTPFDSRPDPVLGAALRAALAPRGSAAFVGRVVAAADRPAAPLVDVLAGWSRLGIAAAVLAALFAGVAIGRDAASGDTATSSPDAEVIIAGTEAPDAITLLASFTDR
jgi:hypothetical protein